MSLSHGRHKRYAKPAPSLPLFLVCWHYSGAKRNKCCHCPCVFVFIPPCINTEMIFLLLSVLFSVFVGFTVSDDVMYPNPCLFFLEIIQIRFPRKYKGLLKRKPSPYHCPLFCINKNRKMILTMYTKSYFSKPRVMIWKRHSKHIYR